MPLKTDIPGQLFSAECAAIAAVSSVIPEKGRMVEVGSHKGKSSWHWAKNSPSSTVYCIDPWEWRPFRGGTLERFKENTKDCPNIVSWQGESPRCAALWDKDIDLYFEDACHQNPVLAENINFWKSFLKPNGIVCGHDYILDSQESLVNERYPDVVKEVDELAQSMGSKSLHMQSFWCILKDPSDPRTEALSSYFKKLELELAPEWRKARLL